MPNRNQMFEAAGAAEASFEAAFLADDHEDVAPQDSTDSWQLPSFGRGAASVSGTLDVGGGNVPRQQSVGTHAHPLNIPVDTLNIPINEYVVMLQGSELVVRAHTFDRDHRSGQLGFYESGREVALFNQHTVLAVIRRNNLVT